MYIIDNMMGFITICPKAIPILKNHILFSRMLASVNTTVFYYVAYKFTCFLAIFDTYRGTYRAGYILFIQPMCTYSNMHAVISNMWNYNANHEHL